MGYEITFFYHERKDGKYDTQERKELKKKLGTISDDVPLEQAAAFIMSQLARRDIWVVDVEIFEFVKKKLNFKESPEGTGVIIKNKKFTLDQAAKLIESDESAPAQTVPPTTMVVTTPNVPGQNIQQSPQPMAVHHQQQPRSDRIMYWVTFQPEEIHLNEIKNFKFTQYNKYPVHNTKLSTIGTLLTLTDDLKRKVEVDEKYFVAVGRGLVGDDEPQARNPQQQAPKPRLAYEDQYIESAKRRTGMISDAIPAHLMEMPNLRPNHKN